MRHPTDGTIRRLVDEPAGVADADREHIAGCPVCLTALTSARDDAATIDAALSVEVGADVDAGWRRLSRGLAADGAPRVVTPRPTRRWRAALQSPVVATVAVATLLAGASAAAAADWLQIFRTEKIAAVTISERDLVKLPDLSTYGEFKVTQEPNVREVPDAAAAEEATGLSIPRVSELPRGVTGKPSFQVAGKASAVFTFSAQKASKLAAAKGVALPPPPPGLEGSHFRVAAGPGVAAVWSEARDVPALVVARAVAPTVYSTGIPFQTARDYLLSLPLPEDVAAQLRTLSGDGTTLPLPVPAEQFTSSTADVGGAPATVLTSRDTTMAAVVWVKGGMVTAVAGSLSVDEVLSVARGLRQR